MTDAVCYYPLDTAFTACGALHGSDGVVTTKDPREVTCDEGCLEIAQDDIACADMPFQGHCLGCRGTISAAGAVEWRRVVRSPCPHCGTEQW